MSETTNTGGDNGGAYTFNSHREALYKILEATVREQAGAGSSRQTSSINSSSGLSFPSPFLWYDEIRPADIDAYHAANDHGRIVCIRSGKVDVSSWVHEDVGSREQGRDLDRSRVAPDDAAIAVEGSRAAVGGHGLVPRTCVAQDCMAGAAAAPAEKEVLDSMQARPCLAAPRNSKYWESEEEKSVMRPDRCTGAVAGLTSSCAKQSSHPHSRADVQQHGRERRRDTDGNNCCSSQSREDICSSPAIPPSISTTPPDPSQATQAMFLPGLPSQVLVTQPQTDAGWEHPEGDESSPREEDSALSEHAFFPSALGNPWSSTEEQPPGPRASIESAEGNAPSVGRGLQSSSSSKGPYEERSCGSKAAAVERGGAAAVDAGLERKDARFCLHEEFTQALREQLEGGGSVVCAGGSAQSTTAPNGSAGGGSGGSREQPEPPFALVATTEVLPSGWSGGQAGAVTFLENQLLLARQRLQDGYAVRALELACHTLRQPKVCVKATEPPGDRLGHACAAAAPRQAEFAGASATASDLPEVVGVPAFVWEILRDAGENPKMT